MAMNFPSSPTVGQTYSVSGGPTYTWDGSVWKVLTPGQQYSPQVFTATAGQTTFTISGGYVIGAIDVFRNGVKLVSGSDYTATDLATVVLVAACSAGDTVEVIKLAQILYTDALKASSNLSDVSNAATALSNLGGLPKAGGTMTGVLDLGAIGQVKFPATQNASADANTLDDYEEGTWTPVMTKDATSPTVTYAAQVGWYVKVGKLVTVYCDVEANSISGGSGAAIIQGLPFASSSNPARNYSVPSFRDCTGIASGGANTIIGGFVQAGNTYVFLQFQGCNGSYGSTSSASWNSSGRVTLSVTYYSAN